MRTIGIGGGLALLLIGCSSLLPRPAASDITPALATENITVESLMEGRKRYVQYCSGCHSLSAPGDRTAEEWNSIVHAMTERSKVDSSGAASIRLYLRTFARPSERTP